jgi:hypothetical protein
LRTSQNPGSDHVKTTAAYNPSQKYILNNPKKTAAQQQPSKLGPRPRLGYHIIVWCPCNRYCRSAKFNRLIDG